MREKRAKIATQEDLKAHTDNRKLHGGIGGSISIAENQTVRGDSNNQAEATDILKTYSDGSEITVSNNTGTDARIGNTIYAPSASHANPTSHITRTIMAEYDAPTWVQIADSLGTQSAYSNMVILDGYIFVGTGSNAQLYRYNNVDAWEMVADTYGANSVIQCLKIFNGKIYAGSDQGDLLEWNGTDAWVSVGSSLFIYSLEVHNETLYAGTYDNSSGGTLLEWNGVDTLTEVAPKLGTQYGISALKSFDGNLYGGTLPNGKLYQWNGTDAWAEKAGQLSSQDIINCLEEYNGELYAGTGDMVAYNGHIFKWNGADAWIDKSTVSQRIMSLLSYSVDGKLYASSYASSTGGYLYVFDDTNAQLIQICDMLNSQYKVIAIIELNEKIYGATQPNGRLFEAFNAIDVTGNIYMKIRYNWVKFNSSGSGGSTSPGGSNTHIQFNDSNAFGGDAGFTYDKDADIATLAGYLSTPKIQAKDVNGLLLREDSGTYGIEIQDDGDIIVKLGDASGSKKISFIDSADNAIASIDSDGNISGVGLTLSGMTSAGFVMNNASGVLSGGNSIAAGDLPSAIDAIKIADGSVTNTEFQYLANVTSDIQTQFGSMIKKDGTVALTADWDIGDTFAILTDQIQARDAAGLLLTDDGNNGIFIEDGGQVGIGTSAPADELHIIKNQNAQTRLRIENTNVSANARAMIRYYGATSTLDTTPQSKGYFEHIGVGNSTVVDDVALADSMNFAGYCSKLLIWQDSTNPIYFFTNSLVRMSIAGAGGVTINDNLTIGDGATGVDYTLVFNGESNDGTFTWMEDEHVLLFDKDIAIGSLRGTSGNNPPFFVKASSFPPAYFDRTTTQTNTTYPALVLIHSTSNDMTDGFGVHTLYRIKDSAGTENTISSFGAVRNGADNTGKAYISVYDAGTERQMLQISDTGFTLGSSEAGVDLVLTFAGETNNGVFTWMEDEDYFKFSDDILMSSAEAIYFRDTAIHIASLDDGHLDLTADISIDINGLMLTQNIQPLADNTYYLGKNDDDTPLAYKGVILKDTTNGKYYRIEVINGVITATDLTD